MLQFSSFHDELHIQSDLWRLWICECKCVCEGGEGLRLISDYLIIMIMIINVSDIRGHVTVSPLITVHLTTRNPTDANLLLW